MIETTVLLLAAAAAVEANTVLLDVPFEIEAPSSVALAWESFENLPPGAEGTLPLVAALTLPAGRGRIDVLRRQTNGWVWEFAAFHTEGFRLSRADYDRGVLLRFSGSAFYFWAEVPARSSKQIVLGRFKNVTIAGAADALATLLYLPSEESPRSISSGESTFSLVSVEPGIVCAMTAAGSGCVDVAESTTRVMPIQARAAARVLRVQPQARDRYEVLARGRSSVLPKNIAVAVARVDPWVAITLPGDKFRWEDLVVHRSGDDFALERIEGSALTQLPLFTSVTSRRDRGIIIHAWIGEAKKRLDDSSALLAVFPYRDDAPAAIPLATAYPGPNGDFDLPTLGSGDYTLKLVSSETAGGMVRLTAVAGIASDVVFPTGPVVSGRLVRAAGGSASDPAVVEVAQATSFGEALRSGDLTDKIRSTIADDTGRFRVVVGSPGKYRLMARWGMATAEREIEISKSMADVDVGDVVLSVGSTLRGFIPGCGEGKGALVPTPDQAAKKLTSGVGEVRHARIERNGRFIVVGLTAGTWGVMANCRGEWVRVSPAIISVPEAGDVAVEFRIEPPE